MLTREVVVILPDIRSTYNTGSFFRTADAVGVQKLYLCGITATPPHPHLLKVSLGAEQSVEWEYKEDVHALIEQLRHNGFQIIAVEQHAQSIDYRQASYSHKVAVLFGNEVAGIHESILPTADAIVSIPMRGAKESLNVSVAGGIILYHLF